MSPGDPLEPLRHDQLDQINRRLAAARPKLTAAFADMTEASRRLGVVFARQRRRILRAAYRSGLLPRPIPRSCYRHRARWAGRRPQRRRRR